MVSKQSLCTNIPFLVSLHHYAVETVEEQIVRNLTEKRIKEIDQSLAQIKEEYM